MKNVILISNEFNAYLLIVPKWASCNQGVFLCIRCAGIHRKLASNISKIKSTTLDAWTSEQVEFMRENGNKSVNRKLLACNPPSSPPSEDDG